jgi:hypothetical protein
VSVLTDPDWVVPPLPAGSGGMDRLRRSVVRFSTGPLHATRRAEVERVLGLVPPDGLRASVREAVLRDPAPPVVPRVPLTVLAAALGVEDPAAVVALVPPVAAAYLPGPPGDAVADAAAEELLERVGAARAAVLVQSCLPVTALVEAALRTGSLAAGLDTTPVPATKRWRDGETVTVPLDGIPFGEGPRRCPGEQHALALAAGVLDALSPDGPDALSPDGPDALSPEAPDPRSPEAPDPQSPEAPDALSPEAPDPRRPDPRSGNAIRPA